MMKDVKVLLIDQIAKVNYKYSFSLARALENRNVNIEMAIDKKEEPEGSTCKKYHLFCTDEKNIGKLSKLCNYFTSYKAIVSLCRSNEYTVLHAQWFIFSPMDYLFLKIIKKKFKTKLIVTIHDILPFNKKFYDYFFHKKIYGLADNIIVQAENNIQRLKERFPNLSKDTVMIPHGHFLDHAEKIEKAQARTRLGLEPDQFVFLFFGQIKKVKGIGILLEAFSRITRQCPFALLMIAGSVWKDHFDEYQEIIDRNKISDRVRTEIRYIPDEEVKYFYSASDICVLPYLDVYQSGVVQLSYAYEKPVIATDLGAFQEVVIENETGFFCKVNDSLDLADKMKLAYNKKEVLDKMGKAGFTYISKKFSWDKIAEDVIALYQL